MNIFDYVIASIIIFCIVRGVFRGIIKEASSIIGVLAGLYAAYTYYPNVSRVIAVFEFSEKYLNILSFLLLFTVVLLMVGALGILIRFVLKIVFLAWVDRLFGGIFGFVRGFMIASVLVFVLTAFLSSGAAIIRESVFTPYVASVAGAMSHFAGQSLRSRFNANMNEAKKSWDNPDSEPSSTLDKKPEEKPKPAVKPAQVSKASKTTKTKAVTTPKKSAAPAKKTRTKTGTTSKKTDTSKHRD